MFEPQTFLGVVKVFCDQHVTRLLVPTEVADILGDTVLPR